MRCTPRALPKSKFTLSLCNVTKHTEKNSINPSQSIISLINYSYFHTTFAFTHINLSTLNSPTTRLHAPNSLLGTRSKRTGVYQFHGPHTRVVVSAHSPRVRSRGDRLGRRSAARKSSAKFLSPPQASLGISRTLLHSVSFCFSISFLSPFLLSLCRRCR